MSLSIMRGRPLDIVNKGETFERSEWCTSNRVELAVGLTTKVMGTPMPG